MKQPPDFPATPDEVRYSQRYRRRAHRRDMRAFFWGAWLMLACVVALGGGTLEGLRSGGWVDLGVRHESLPVPWWIAAAITLATLAVSLWCFGRYATLKATQPPVQPDDEEDDND